TVHLQNRRTFEFDRPVQNLFAGFDIKEDVDMWISPIHVRYDARQIDSLAQIELTGNLVMRPRSRCAKEQGGYYHSCAKPPISLVSCHNYCRRTSNLPLPVWLCQVPVTDRAGSSKSLRVPSMT